MSLHAIVTAHANGFDENMYLDSATRTKVEETGGANFIFVTKDNKIVTPHSDTILPSITRRSIMYVAEHYLGLEVEERDVYFDEVKDFAECGLCGTAAVISLGEEVEVSKAILEKLPEGAVVRSPGMKYKHYAPKADVTLLNGTFEQFKAYVDAHMDQNPSCLCFTGEAEKLGVPCVEYGREGDGADQAKHIFRSLRALDEQGDGIVYARCPQKDGLSMAVYNRLIRAAAFRVIDL